MSKQVEHILRLTELIQLHENITHWTVSKRISTKSDYLDRLMKGGDTGTRVAEGVLLRLSHIWPLDLEWPADIPRPEDQRRKAAS